MGYSCTNLIPAAILFDNPGITREEFAFILNQTNCSWIYEFSSQDPWDFTEVEKFIDFVSGRTHHDGIHGLGHILGLKKTEKYQEAIKFTKDLNGIPIPSPYLFISSRRKGRIWVTPEYEVTVHAETEILPEKEVHSLSWDKLDIGRIWEETLMGMERGVVTEIMFERNTYKEKDPDGFYEDSGPEYFYVMRIIPFNVYIKRVNFESLEELVKEFPQFHPDFMYDFSQETGFIHGGLENDKDFIWNKCGEKYYLDKETFDKILPGGMARYGGYSRLVATAEAIKQKAWKLLSYRGDKHLQQFLNDFPDSRRRYERAVWDSQVSLSAKLQQMTYTQLLRYRMLSPNAI